jgi:hypothetical protein
MHRSTFFRRYELANEGNWFSPGASVPATDVKRKAACGDKHPTRRGLERPPPWRSALGYGREAAAGRG